MIGGTSRRALTRTIRRLTGGTSEGLADGLVVGLVVGTQSISDVAYVRSGG